MVTLAIILAIVFVTMAVYSIPGLVLARGMYAAAAKELNSTPGTIVPPMPERPRFTLKELLHDSGLTNDGRKSVQKRCQILEGAGVCTCSGRANWSETRENWRLYNEWKEKYGHIKDPLTYTPTINMKPIYWAVPGWPVVAAAMFIKNGAKGIPDYRAIERIENELKGLE